MPAAASGRRRRLAQLHGHRDKAGKKRRQHDEDIDEGQDRGLLVDHAGKLLDGEWITVGTPDAIAPAEAAVARALGNGS